MSIFLQAFVVPFLISVIIAIPLIKWLKILKFGQTERVEGVQSHLAKQGTPTMGGIIFIIATTLANIPVIIRNADCLVVLITALCYGLIGFIDDYLKVVKKKSDGLKAREKFALQALVCFIVIVYFMFKNQELLFYVRVPLLEKPVFIGYFGVVLLFFAFMGTINAVNFTDGVDGLATSVTIIVAGFFALVAFKLGNNDLMLQTICLMSALLAFLIFNSNPAKVFMGDTGSLFLGGFIVALSYMMGMELFIILVGIVYFIEILSVMIQVTYFKRTGGKRIFKMTPIHHHFELSGMSEKEIVGLFSIVTLIASIIAYMLLAI